MTDDPVPESLDLEALDLGPMLRHARAATFAPNWKSVLLTDLAVGLVIIILGVVAMLWVPLIGWLLVGVGVFYVFLVFRRARQWRFLRTKAGLD